MMVAGLENVVNMEKKNIKKITNAFAIAIKQKGQLIG
jgi:hypothetical protein